MIKTTVKVDGMMCGMCESHVNDAVRKVFQVDKVTSSHSKGETVIISEKPVDEAKLKTAISAYKFVCFFCETSAPKLCHCVIPRFFFIFGIIAFTC